MLGHPRDNDRKLRAGQVGSSRISVVHRQVTSECEYVAHAERHFQLAYGSRAALGLPLLS